MTMRRRLITLAAGMAFSFSTALGQPQDPSNLDLLRDFIHFVKINNPELAASQARQLLDRGLSPAQFVDLVEQSQELARFEDSVARAMRVAEACLRNFPNNPPQRRELVKLYMKHGPLPSARQHLGIFLDPERGTHKDDIELLEMAAICEVGFQDYGKAAAYLQKAIDTLTTKAAA